MKKLERRAALCLVLAGFLLAGLAPHQAIATNKLSSSVGTTVSTARYCKNGYFHKKFVEANAAGLIMVSESLFASIISVVGGMEPITLNLVVGGLLITIAMVLTQKKGIKIKEIKQLENYFWKIMKIKANGNSKIKSVTKIIWSKSHNLPEIRINRQCF